MHWLEKRTAQLAYILAVKGLRNLLSKGRPRHHGTEEEKSVGRNQSTLNSKRSLTSLV